jgi:GT2 family glycosyltransferase
MPTLSVSIVTYHPDFALLQDVLARLATAVSVAREAGVLEEATLVVADNSLDESAVATIRHLAAQPGGSRWDQTQVVVPTRNVGYGAGHNRAFERCPPSDYHLVLNPDVLLAPTALLEALGHMERDPQAGLLAPAVQGPGDELSHLCKRYPSVADLLVRGFAPDRLRGAFRGRLARYEMHELSLREPSRGIPIASGCFMFLRADLFRGLGGFCERYFLYFEDFDLSMRARRRADIVIVPSVRIQHLGGEAARKGMAHVGMFLRSGLRFFSEHGWRLW